MNAKLSSETAQPIAYASAPWTKLLALAHANLTNIFARSAYLHIVTRARSGLCFESVPNMAKATGMCARKFRDALAMLKDWGMVEVTYSNRGDQTSDIVPTEPETWIIGGQLAHPGTTCRPTPAPHADKEELREEENTKKRNTGGNAHASARETSPPSIPIAPLFPKREEDAPVSEEKAPPAPSRPVIVTRAAQRRLTSLKAFKTPDACEAWKLYSKAFDALHNATPLLNRECVGVLERLVPEVGLMTAQLMVLTFLGAKNRHYHALAHPLWLLEEDATKLKKLAIQKWDVLTTEGQAACLQRIDDLVAD